MVEWTFGAARFVSMPQYARIHNMLYVLSRTMANSRASLPMAVLADPFLQISPRL